MAEKKNMENKEEIEKESMKAEEENSKLIVKVDKHINVIDK